MLKPSSDASAIVPADAAIAASEMRFRHLLEKLPAGAYTCDADGLITYYNQHAVEVWGRKPTLRDPADRFCGSYRMWSAKDGRQVPPEECWMALALRDNKPYNGHELVVERPDGSRVTVLAHANPFHDDQGRVIGAVNVLVDISERKRHENALRDADRTKNEFLATLAHELRNPLAPIRNVVQILQIKGPQAADLGWALEVIDRQIRQMTRLIDDLLDLSRITANKLELRREKIELAEVLRTAVETARPLIDASGHEFIVTQPRRRVLLDGDSTRLAQVLSNLLINAAKYTPAGGRIRLVAHQRGGQVVLRVRDTGVGISRELLPRIFDLFTQGHDAVSETPDGLGVGLTLARRLVDMHGGAISAHSRGRNRGSEFVVRLPIVVRDAAPKRRRRRAGLVSAARRILLVDDNAASATSLRALLQIVGHDVRVAHDGASALRIAEHFRPDAALLDIGLPKMNGYELARRLKRRAWARELLLVAVTGWGQATDREHSREAGFHHHLVKPVDPNELLRLLKVDAGPRAAAPATRAGTGHGRGAVGGTGNGNGHWKPDKRVQIVPLPLGTR